MNHNTVKDSMLIGFGCTLKMAYNGWHIPEGGDYEAQNYQLTMNINRSTDVHFSTTPPSFGYMLLSAGLLQILIK